MSRYFTVKTELDRMDRGLLVDAGDEWGTVVDWRRYDPTSVRDDVYDVGAPRAWGVPIEVPVLWATRIEGRHRGGDTGLDPADALTFAVAKTVLRDRLGWEEIVEREGINAFLRDRVIYEGRTFTIDSIQVEGQLGYGGGDRDVMVAVTAREVKPGDQSIDEAPQKFTDEHVGGYAGGYAGGYTG